VDGDNNIFTVYGFKAMLPSLKTALKLTVLDMQLPHVKELYIREMGTYLLLNLGVGDRGAQFIAQNLKNLIELDVGK
jgi:hypothetical protein